MTELEPVPTELSTDVGGITSWAKALVIQSKVQYEDAAERLKQIKTIGKRIADWFKPMKQRADEAKRAILDAEKQLADPLSQAEQMAKIAMLKYTRAEEEKAEAQRRIMQAEIDAKAKAEREALEKKAAAAKRPETKEKYAEQAAQIVAPTVHIPVELPKVAGQSVRKTWKADVVKLDELCKFICDNQRHDLIIVNEKVLDAYAKAMKERASMPGVHFYEHVTLASRGAA